MYTWVYYMKTLAAMLITNSHYGNIWPISTLACGGLLGDVIYLAISGFCLYNIKDDFVKWYRKRISRIYPTLWIVTILAVGVGFLPISDIKTLGYYFFYPTFYHFIKSIMILYVVYYSLITISRKFKIKVNWLIIITIGIYILIYCIAYDKSYYHIDVVEEWMIQFVFLTAMLIGAWFREKMQNETKKMLSKKTIFITIFWVLIYFASKIVFSKVDILSSFQIFNTLLLLVALYYLLKVSIVLENKKDYLLWKTEPIVKYVANITLEIYLVQYLVFYLVPEMSFPADFIVVTASIVLSAQVINWLTSMLRKIKVRG